MTLALTYRFAILKQRPLADPYFTAALQEAKSITDPENNQRSQQTQALVMREWLISLRFRIQIHDINDKPRAELRKTVEMLLQEQSALADALDDNAIRGFVLLQKALSLTDSVAKKLLLGLEAVRLYERSTDHEGLIRSLSLVGSFAGQIGDYPRVMEAYKRVVRMSNVPPNWLAIAYNEMGFIYAQLSDTAKAIESFTNAEHYLGEYGYKYNRMVILQGIGKFYQQTGYAEKARRCFERALMLNKELRDDDAYIRITSGRLYRELDSLEASLADLNIALRQAQALSVYEPLGQALLEIALTYHARAHRYRTSKPLLARSASDSALWYAKQSLRVMTDHAEESSIETLVEVCQLLFAVSKERGDMQAALHYMEQYHRWNDSTVSNTKYREIAAMDSRAVVEAVEAKLAVLQANERVQRTVTIAATVTAIAVAMMLVVLFWRYQERKKSSALLQTQNEQLKALNEEKTEIMGIVAHDLKNPLFTIRLAAEFILRYFSP